MKTEKEKLEANLREASKEMVKAGAEVRDKICNMLPEMRHLDGEYQRLRGEHSVLLKTYGGLCDRLREQEKVDTFDELSEQSKDRLQLIMDELRGNNSAVEAVRNKLAALDVEISNDMYAAGLGYRYGFLKTFMGLEGRIDFAGMSLYLDTMEFRIRGDLVRNMIMELDLVSREELVPGMIVWEEKEGQPWRVQSVTPKRRSLTVVGMTDGKIERWSGQTGVGFRAIPDALAAVAVDLIRDFASVRS